MLQRLPIRSSFAILATLGIWTVPADSAATCLTQCDATLKYFDCTEPPPNQWDNTLMLSFDLGCQTCCSPPGGPLVCEETEPELSLLSLSHLGQPYDGTFFLSKSACKTGPLIMFNPALETGPYELLYENMILAQFTAGAQSGCKTNDQCPKCSVCVNGECKGLGLIACTQDSDCGKGQMCKVDPDAPCANQCVPIEEDECKTDADCPPCWACAEGECKATGFAICTQDSDCGDGKLCLVDPVAPCNNQCVAKEPGCTSDEDCGSCAVCVAGECKGLGLIVCTSDGDCLPGEGCSINKEDPCKNTCVAIGPECTSDSDCAVCAVCVAGECKGLGLIVCVTDSDCDAGLMCEVSPIADCYNACVPTEPIEDAGSSDDTGSQDMGSNDTGSVGDTTEPNEDTAGSAELPAETDTADTSVTDQDTQPTESDAQNGADTGNGGDGTGSKPKDDGGCATSADGNSASPLWILVCAGMIGFYAARRRVFPRL